jgi:hypothetical protein
LFWNNIIGKLPKAMTAGVWLGEFSGIAGKNGDDCQISIINAVYFILYLYSLIGCINKLEKAVISGIKWQWRTEITIIYSIYIIIICTIIHIN